MARSWHSHRPEPSNVFGSSIGGNLPRFPMKLTASAIGSLALVFAAAACEQRSDNTMPEQTNAPGTTSTPGTTATPSASSRTNPSSQDPNGMNSNPGAATPAMPSGSSISEKDTQPVKGSDMEPMGTGGAGGGGSGHGGHGGHAGKSSH